MWETIEHAEHAMKGTWPVAGGLLNQTAAFVAAFELIRSQKNKHELDRLEALKRLHQHG